MSGEDDDKLKDYRAPEPKEGVGTDDDGARPSPPVADDDGSPDQRPEPVKVQGVEERKEPDEKPPTPRLTPFDEKRAKIAERFAPTRRGESIDTDLDFSKPENVYGKLAGPETEPEPPPDPNREGADDATKKAPAEPGPSAFETLVVNGRTVTKTRAEIAALADMTEEEVASKPQLARKFAQRELATSENLERTRRATPARQQDEGTRPDRPAQHQGDQTGEDDDPDQRPAARDTSDAELWEKLVEDIQIGDPKEVAPKLAKALEQVAERRVTTNEQNQRRSTELNANISAVKEFLDEHPELEGKGAVAAAISGKLDEEYRADLRSVLINEGETPADADAILAQAGRDDVRNAHLARRLDRNPHVRKIDKAMIATVYGKVRADFGVTDENSRPQQQGLSRQDRKDALPLQPRRASVPPATSQAPSAPISRKAAVAEMAARTGRKPASLNR